MLFLACWAGHEECHSGPQIDPMHKLCTEAHIVVEHPKAQCTLVTIRGNGTSRDSETQAPLVEQKRFCKGFKARNRDRYCGYLAMSARSA